MQLLDHASISVTSLAKCSDFYDAVMKALDCEKVYDTKDMLGYGLRCYAGQENHSYLAVYKSVSANIDNARHWCFKATSREMVNTFYRAGMENGGQCNGPPGLRESYHPNYYGAFLFDPFGNRIEVVCHHAL